MEKMFMQQAGAVLQETGNLASLLYPVPWVKELSSLESLFKLGWWEDEEWSVIKRQNSSAVKVIIFVTSYYTGHEMLAQSLPLPHSLTWQRPGEDSLT